MLYYELLTSKALISSETHHKHIILKHYAKNNPLSLKLYFDIQLVLCICVYVRETQRYWLTLILSCILLHHFVSFIQCSSKNEHPPQKKLEGSSDKIMNHIANWCLLKQKWYKHIQCCWKIKLAVKHTNSSIAASNYSRFSNKLATYRPTTAVTADKLPTGKLLVDKELNIWRLDERFKLV